MRYVRAFIAFWVDFIVGDAWEVAVGLGATLALIALVAHQWGGEQALGFLLLAAVLAVTALALARATAGARRG